MSDEARIERTPAGLKPADDGWYVLSLKDMAWASAPGRGTWSEFQSASGSPKLGIGVHVLEPGQAPGFYHAESELEGFLILSGECVAVVEGQERTLRQWDYLHCPPGTAHITIGTGDAPCAILMFGLRDPEATIRYLVDAAAARHGASVAAPTDSPAEAYAGEPPSAPAPAPPPFA